MMRQHVEPVTLTDQVAEVRRELAMRERVYPMFVARKKLTQERADRQIIVMRAVLETVERAAATVTG